MYKHHIEEKAYLFHILQPLLFVDLLADRKTYSGCCMPILQIFETSYYHLLVFYFLSTFFNNCSSFDNIYRQLTIFVMFLRSLYTHSSSSGFSKIEHLPGAKAQLYLQAKVEQTGGVVRLPVEVRKTKSGFDIK